MKENFFTSGSKKQFESAGDRKAGYQDETENKQEMDGSGIDGGGTF